MRRTAIILTVVFAALSSADARAGSPARGTASAQFGARVKVAAVKSIRRQLPEGYEEKFFARVRAGDTRAVRRMLARGADPDAVNEGGTPAIVLAAKVGSLPLVRVLLDFGAAIDADDGSSYTALHYASQSGDLKLVSLLLARGADVNRRGYDDHTVLMFAMHGASWGRMPAPVREYVMRDDEDDDEGGDGLTPKRLGTAEAYRGVAARLIAAGAEVNVVADCGETALFFASRDAELTRMLLAAGARVDYGWSPLCLVGGDPLAKMGAGFGEAAGEIGGGGRRAAVEETLRAWWAETAGERREVEQLLVGAGATRHDCGDEEDEPEVEEDKPEVEKGKPGR